MLKMIASLYRKKRKEDPRAKKTRVRTHSKYDIDEFC